MTIISIDLPDGPVVEFDPAAMRAWLATRDDTAGESPASDAGISVDNPYTPQACNPGDWLDYLLLRMRYGTTCPGWKVQPGVAVEAHHTADFEGNAGDGGAIIVVDLGAPIRFATQKLTSKDLVSTRDDKTKLDAAVETFQSAADAINSMFDALRAQ